MKKIILIVIMMLMTTFSTWANDQSFYFIAKATNEGVYLRWDVVEGNFPQNSDIDYLVLKRNDLNISILNPNRLMSELEIQTLYQNPSNQVSLMRVIDSISKNNDATCSGANLNNYASKIRGCMQENMWRSMASKVDFNIATIGHRAYLDKMVISSPTTYELIAVKESAEMNRTERLGKVVVNPSLPTSVLGAKNFKQLYQVDRAVDCNAPEYAKDDYTLSLSWENGGTQTDAFANSMMLAGYDLYRDRVNNQEAPQELKVFQDLTTATVDGKGDYQFPNMEKVNDVPYLLGNSEGDETPLYLETKNELKKAGLKPGDSRWYYLVAKDFTGHYGPAVALKVTVPDLLAPITPWGVRVIESNKKAKLIWDKVNVANYVNYYKNSRKFCNVETLSPNQRLHFVDREGTCGTKEVEVNLNVDKYYIYRFDNPSNAAKFVDSDLDGIGDLDEKKEEVCVANSQYGSALIKVLDATDFSGREFVSFVDETVDHSKYYWYRIAAVSENGASVKGSILTSPIRAMIPDRTLPTKVNPELKACASNYIVAAYSLEGEIPYIAYDETKRAKEVRLTCSTNAEYALFTNTRYLPVDENGYVASSESLCDCNSGTIEFLDEKRNLLARKTLCNSFINGCSSAKEFYVLKAYDCSYDGLELVHTGEDLYSWPILELEQEVNEDECLEFTIINGSKRDRITRKCDRKKRYDLEDLNLSNLGKGEKFCIGVNVLNANNQYSPTTYLPCFGVVDRSKPNRPDIRMLTINENNISVAWISPQEKIASTIVSLYNDENRSQSYLRTYAHPAHIDQVSMDALTMSRDIDVLLNNINRGQKWCIKAKSLGFNGETSEWSRVKCTQNLAQEEQTDYLAWPKITTPSKYETLQMEYHDISSSGMEKFYINGLIMPISEKEFSIVGGDDFNYQTNFYLDERFYTQVEKEFASTPLNFTLYRQTILNDEKTNFIQVSPLVNKVKYKKFITLYTTDNGRYYHYLMEFENNLYMDVIVFGKTTFFCKATLYYKDNYPYYQDTNYKYVKVDFDKNHEIVKYSVSDIVRTGDELLSQAPVGESSIPLLELADDKQELQPLIQQIELFQNKLRVGGAQ